MNCFPMLGKELIISTRTKDLTMLKDGILWFRRDSRSGSKVPRLDRQMFEQLSKETTYQVDLLEKVYRLTELLKEITSTKLKDNQVLKGGTALNFVHLDLPRLSVDIDMDYIGSTEKDHMLDEREKIDRLSRKIFDMLDYEPELKETYALDKYDLYYKNSVGNRDRIKLEINYLKRSTILKPIEMNLDHIFDFEKFKVLTLKIEELFGRKLNALVRRATPKDLYDIYRLLQSPLKYDMDLTKKCFIFSLCLDSDPRKVEYNAFEEITPHDVWTSLTPVLKKKENVEFEEMKKEVKPVLEQMCDFSKGEKRFIRTLFDDEKYEIEILFEDYPYNESILEHPGIEWRLKNL